MRNMLNVSDEKLRALYGDSLGKADFEKRVDELSAIFAEKFDGEFTDGFSSPGRIEICGNHTDHNHGKVVVGAINCDTFALVRKAKYTVAIHSVGFGDIAVRLDMTAALEEEKGTSAAIVKGVINGFRKRGFNVGGFEGVMSSSVFKGAGVSSSASFELLICQILNYYYNDGAIDEITLAKIGQEAENVYFGKPCGLLDQSGIALGGINAIDFNDPEDPVVTRLGNGLADLEIILVNTGSHENLTDEYAAIRVEMGEVASYFGKTVLRDVPFEEFVKALPRLKAACSGRAILRAMHFYGDNSRCDQLKDYIANADKEGIKSVINASGVSSATVLQNLYAEGDKVQGIPLAVNSAKLIAPNCAARVHGGGFAGTAIIFTEKAACDTLVNALVDVFGSENVFKACVRELGACHI